MALCSEATCMGCGHMLGGYGWILQAVILLLIVLIFWWLFSGQRFNLATGKESPLDILKRRLAAGEITQKEYERLKKELN